MTLRTCELLGLAGAGRSSLIRGLKASNDSVLWHIESDGPLGMRAMVYPLWLQPRLCLESLLRLRERGRWVGWREIAWVEERRKSIGRSGDRDGVLLFERGPLHKLARIDTFTGRRDRNGLLEAWWCAQVRWWLMNLDLIVLLEAPLAVLARRVRQRDSGRRSRYETHEAATEYGRAFERIWSAADGTPAHLMRLDTSRESVDQIAHRVLGALQEGPSQKHD